MAWRERSGGSGDGGGGGGGGGETRRGIVRFRGTACEAVARSECVRGQGGVHDAEVHVGLEGVRHLFCSFGRSYG